jgi:hypothetical protein
MITDEAAEIRQPVRTSEMLFDLVEGHPEPEISVGAIIDAFGDRSFGAVITLMALPNCLPGPPGFGSIFGIPVVFFAAQLALAQRRPWLPKRLRGVRVPTGKLRNIIRSGRSYIEKFERICRPRLLDITGPRGERAIAVMLVFLGLVVSLPVPFSNMIPGWGIAICGLGIVERDGGAVILGIILGLIGFVISGSFLVALILGFAAIIG